jgi:hypothetical protein
LFPPYFVGRVRVGFLCCEFEMKLRSKSPATPPPTPPVGQGARKNRPKIVKYREVFNEKWKKEFKKKVKRDA